MSSTSFDIIFAGAGAAALHTAMALVDKDPEHKLRILLVDPREKQGNDRTWCFWEEGQGQWDHLLSSQWTAGTMKTQGGQAIDLDMGNFSYKMLRSDEFYSAAKTKLASHGGVEWLAAEVQDIREEHGRAVVRSSQGVLEASMVLDSRIPDGFQQNNDAYLRLKQHFYGQFIEFDEEVFDSTRFTMMDFSRASERTDFFYILPLDERRALIEYTLFTEDVLTRAEYETELEGYIKAHFPYGYKVLEEEQGIIPMSDYPFESGQGKRVLRIGTAGGWVKPSTGYHFKNAERFGEKLAQNIVDGEALEPRPWKIRHRYYDRWLLDILVRDNQQGPGIFSRMYQRFPAHLIFRFLDEGTSFRDELSIMSGFDPRPFLWSVVRSLTR